MPDTTTEPRTLTIALPATLSLEREPDVERELSTIANAILVSLSVSALTEDFTRRREALITEASNCLQTVTPDEEAAGASAMKHLKQFSKEVSANAKALRDPLNAASKRIKELEDQGLLTIEKATNRLRSMLDARAAEKIDEQRKQEAAAKAAADKIEADRLAAEAAAEKLRQDQLAAEAANQKAEQDARKAQEAAERANSPEAKAAALKAQQDAAAAQAKAAEDAAKLKEQQEAAELAADMASLAPAPAAVAPIAATHGYSAREFRDYEIIGRPDEFRMHRSLQDFAIFALTSTDQRLVTSIKVEVKRSVLIDFLKDPDFLAENPPGLKIIKKIASSSR